MQRADDVDTYRQESFKTFRRTAVTVSEEHGLSDGITMDVEGKLWVAHWDGWCIRRWDPTTGQLLHEIRFPVARPTSYGSPLVIRRVQPHNPFQ